MNARLVSIQTGRIAPLGPERVPSGFVKRDVSGAVAVQPLGLEGDEQADLTVHGGPDKAVYGYAASHYPAWRDELPGHAERLKAGAFGENLTIESVNEDALCVGDIHAIGTARLQVCQPRQPCFKLGLYFEDARLPKALVRSGRAGWYYRVIESGTIRPGDAVTLHDRPHPDFAFARLVRIVNFGGATEDELARLAQMSGLAIQWQRRAMAALHDLRAG
jgi:MOSC domain-containing protein YiiM